MLTLAQLDAAADLVHAVMPPTPQINWPLLAARCGVDLWVKHENHTPIGAFKIRGGLVYMADLRKSQPDVKGVISATRGNHGQSVALPPRRPRLPPTPAAPPRTPPANNPPMP